MKKIFFLIQSQAKGFFLVAILLLGSLFLFSNALANQGTVTVEATVPAVCGNGIVEGGEQCDGGGANGACPAVCSAACALNNCNPGGGGAPDNPPTINNVVVGDITKNSARIAWQANDDRGIQAVTFVYGLTNAYGSNGNVVGNVVNLNGLNPDTTYFFKISVVDTGGQTTNHADTFKTLKEVDNDMPPVVSNIKEVVRVIDATISWDTNEDADSQIAFGLNNQYNGPGSGLVLDNNLKQQHSLNLLNLLPDTLYHYQIIATDAAGNSQFTVDHVFTTQKDNVPPPDVANFQLNLGQNFINLKWVNPDVPDFVGVRILRKVGAGGSQNINDGLLVYQGAAENFIDRNVLLNTEYTYTAFSYDTSGNYSGGVMKSGKIVPPIAREICDNGIDDNGDGLIDCQDAGCANFPACLNFPPRQQEVCDNGIDDNGNGLIDCADPACANFPACVRQPPAPREVCNNGLDDDGNGLVDCNDPACFVSPFCKQPINPPANPGVNEPLPPPPPPNVPDFVRINLGDIMFLGGNRQVNLPLNGQKIVSLTGSSFTVGIPKRILVGPPTKLILEVQGGSTHQFVYNPVANIYFSDIIFPSPGMHAAYVEVNYGNNQVDSVQFNLSSLSLGQIKAKNGEPLEGVEVMLLNQNQAKINTGPWGESNPIVTSKNGAYGWVVPNGQYFIQVKKGGYFDRKIPVGVVSNIINSSVDLVAKPPPLKFDPKAPLGKNIQNIAGNLAVQLGDLSQVAVQQVQDISNNPVVQETASNVVAPAVVGVVAVGTISLISWSSLLSFFQFLFLQPLLLLGKKKREQWGQVYNTLNKLPVDLAVVRLVDAATGRIMQSRVTDTKGRYILNAKPGKYHIVVNKENFIFPSVLLKDLSTDGNRVDIYHGEVIEVTENDMVLTANIPLDPVGAGERPKRLVWQKFFYRLQLVLSWMGFIITGVSFYISHRWYVGALLVVHILLFLLFRRLATLKKPKGWGIVYDFHSHKPIAKVVARLFDSQFNKLVASEVTDDRGRYYFLAGDNKYYVTYSRADYAECKTEVIDTSGNKSDLIAPNIAMKKLV